MSDSDILQQVKIDLGVKSDALDDHLTKLISASREYIATEGITLDTESSAGDAELVAMYAAYLWRHRRDGDQMGRMLRTALNNRLMQEKGAVSESDTSSPAAGG